MKKILQVIKNRWAEYLLEILVIIIGISLTLLFNNWREKIIENKEETKLLQSIRENLVSDTLMLEKRLTSIDLFISGNKKLLSSNVDSFPSDSLALYIDFVATYTKFQANRIGYKELEQSKSSTIIKNRELLQKIILHYEQKYDLMNEWNDVDKNFVLNDMIPFLSKNFKYSDSPFLFDDAKTTISLLENDDYFKNIIKSGSIYKQIIKMLYVQLKHDTRDLIQAIDEELK
ncbi:MAG: hypothetical protein AB8G11_10020 [Saprospiraceae bacterium]